MAKAVALSQMLEHLCSHPAVASRYLSDTLQGKDVVALAKTTGSPLSRSAVRGMPPLVPLRHLAPLLTAFLGLQHVVFEEADCLLLWQSLDAHRSCSALVPVSQRLATTTTTTLPLVSLPPCLEGADPGELRQEIIMQMTQNHELQAKLNLARRRINSLIANNTDLKDRALVARSDCDELLKKQIGVEVNGVSQHSEGVRLRLLVRAATPVPKLASPW